MDKDIYEMLNQLYERIAKVEAKQEEQSCDLKDIKEKLNGYLENKIKTTVKAMLGEVLLAVITSSAVITLILTRIFK